LPTRSDLHSFPTRRSSDLGQEVGGIRIRALSDIDPRGLTFALTISRQKREPYVVPLLDVSTNTYPDDKFNAGLQAMTDAMQSGKMTLQQVIAQCQKTGSLTAEQLAKLEAAAPVVIDEHDDSTDNDEEMM